MEMLNLFPVGVGKANLNRSLTAEEDAAFNEIAQNVVGNTGNTRSGNFYVLEVPLLSNLKQDILNAANEYISIFYNPVDGTRFRITQSWVNYTTANQSHHAHTHPNSMISGVYYPQAVGQIDNISFRHSHPSQIIVNTKRHTSYSASAHTVSVNSGDIIFFPSWLEHNVPPLPVDYKGTRVSVAFNLFPENELGTDYMLNRLSVRF